MARRWRPRGKSDPSDEPGSPAAEAEPVIVLTSSDDEEANVDLSLAVIEKAKQREAIKREAKRKISDDSVLNIASSSSDDDAVLDRIDATPVPQNEDSGETKKKKKKKEKKVKNKKKKNEERQVAEIEIPDAEIKGEETAGLAESVITEANEVPNNVILRKLLRGPRYFDPGRSILETCFNCGEEGHLAINCSLEKRKKPCFVCGLFGHSGNRCTQGQECYICKRKGHVAKDCPDKNKKGNTEHVKICLKCGDLGHNMFTCANNYPPEDLKDIQCYVCKKQGHLCCAELAEDYPKEVSCYNCAQTGHTGAGCAKPRGESGTVASQTYCYKCGEEGHFARGCKMNKSARSLGESSTPIKKPAKKKRDPSTPSYKPSKKKRDSLELRSAPHEFGGKSSKRKEFAHDNNKRHESMAGKPRKKYGWIVDDPGDLPSPPKKYKSNGWGSAQRTRKVFGSSEDYSTPTSHRLKRHRPFFGSPDSGSSRWGPRQHEYSASRFSNNSHNSHTRFGWS